MAEPTIKVVSTQHFQSIKEFELDLSQGRNTIGKGSFGVVKLALHKGSNKLYALKIIDLTKVESEPELKIIEREIELHSSLDHPHIIKIWDTLVEDSIVYMVMDSAERGNLFFHQNSKGKFQQAQAFQYFYQCVLAVDYLHRHDIIHRDIKPENLLLDHSLNIKLCDFGWAALDINMKRTTFCGTYEYMAPQMILKRPYDYKVDIWGLGILLFQMLHGFAPFRGTCLQEVAQKIHAGQYQISPSLSEQLKDMIRLVLQFDPNKRPTTKNILMHPWIERMKNIVNSFLKKNEINLSSIVPLKLAKMTDEDCNNIQRRKTHRKAQSTTNCPIEKKNIQINFQINNYGLVGNQSAKKLTGRCKTLTEESIKKLMSTHSRKPTMITTGNSQQSLKTSKTKKSSRLGSKSRLQKQLVRSNTQLSETMKAQRKKKSIDDAVRKLSKKYLENIKVPGKL